VEPGVLRPQAFGPDESSDDGAALEGADKQADGRADEGSDGGADRSGNRVLFGRWGEAVLGDWRLRLRRIRTRSSCPRRIRSSIIISIIIIDDCRSSCPPAACAPAIAVLHRLQEEGLRQARRVRLDRRIVSVDHEPADRSARD